MDNMIIIDKGRSVGKTEAMMQDILARRDPDCYIFGQAVVRRLEQEMSRSFGVPKLLAGGGSSQGGQKGYGSSEPQKMPSFRLFFKPIHSQKRV